MFNKKNLNKINFVFSLLTILIYIFEFFSVQWRGDSIVNNVPSLELSLFAPIKSILVDLVGASYAQLINNIACLNIIYYVIIVIPIYLFHWVRGLIFND